MAIDQDALNANYAAEQQALNANFATAKPPPPNGALNEIGTGLARGALVGLPSLAGRALQYVSEPGRALYSTGQGMVDAAEARGQRPSLTLRPEDHNVVTNALASGAEMVPAVLPAIAAGVGAATLGLPALATTAIGAAAGGALFGASAGQETLDKARKAGVDEATAKEAARLNAATTMAGQTALGMVGGQFAGAIGKGFSGIVGREGESLAASTMAELFGQGGVLKPVLRQLPATAAEAVGANAAQSAASAGIERSYGIDSTSPTDAALGSVMPTLGLTALLGPMALVSRAMNVRAAKTRTESLANPETPVDIRAQLADTYTNRLAAVDPSAAINFATNAELAINKKLPLPVDSTLLSPDAVRPPAPPAPAAMIGFDANRVPNPNGEMPFFTFPDGTTTRSPQEAEQYVRSLPENQQAAARARLLGMGEEPVAPVAPAPARTEQIGFDANRVPNPNGELPFYTFPDGTTTRSPQEAERFVRGLPENEQAAARAKLLGLGEQPAAPPEATPAVPREPNAPKPPADIATDWRAAMAANDMDAKAQSLVPFMKRVDAMGIDKMATHQEQIDALQTLVDDKKVSQGMRDRASMLVEQWKKELPAEAKPPVVERTAAAPALDAQAPREQAIPGQPATGAQAALGENIPAKPAAIAGDQAPVAVAESNLPIATSRMPITDMATAASDRVAALRAEFTERIRGGEKLTPLEQERYDDLNGLARSLQPYLEGNAKPRDAEFVKAMAGMVDEASSPYKRTLRDMAIPGPKMDHAYAEDMGLLAPAALSHKISDVLGHLEANGSAPWVKDLAAKLKPLVGDTQVWPGVAPDRTNPRYGFKDGVGAFGAAYLPEEGRVDVYPAGATEKTMLHESVHIATVERLDRAEAIKRPKNQEEARLKSAYNELESLRKLALETQNAKATITGEAHYGLTSAHEFLAELHSNREFQDFLRNNGGPKSWWVRALDAVRGLIGKSSVTSDMLDRAMALSDEFMSPRQLNEKFDASPEGAATATDITLRRTLADVDRKAYGIDVGKADLKATRAVLPVQTLNYIVDRVATNPELVASGFAAGAQAHTAARTAHDVVLNRLNDIGSKFVSTVERMYRGMDESKSTAVDRELATIGGEASRVGFDYRKNGRDNMAADPSIDASSKAHIDDIHRRFTQLQKTNPEAAKALEEGERINRRQLIEKVATIASQLMDSRGERARHLEAELARMPAADANRARKEAEAQLVTTESLMAAAHSKGLDLMDPTLAQGKNPDPVRFHDAATATLGARLQTAFDAARKLPEGSPLRDAMQSLETMYAKEAKHPYFSLGRTGDYFVNVNFKGIDAAANARIQDVLKNTTHVVGDLTRGDSNAFFRVRNADEAHALHDRLVAAGEGKVVDPSWGRLSEKVRDMGNVSPALRTLLSSVDDLQISGLSGAQVDTVKQAITRQLLSMLPETASRSASLGRRGIPGYDANFLEQFSRRATGGVHDIAGIYSSRAFMTAAKQRADAIEQLNKTGSAEGRERAQLVDDEINKRHNNDMHPVPADKVAQATSLAHSFYLGLSPANLIRTQAQLWQRGLPVIGSKFGWASSIKELGAAQAVGMKVVANSVRAAVAKDGVHGLLNAPVELEGLNLPPREQAWLEDAHATGKLDLGASAQLLRAATAPGDRKMQDTMRYVAAVSQYSEMAARMGVGLAALRQAIKRPELLGAHETPETYAHKAMERAMDDFSPSNTGRALGRHGFAGPLTPLFTQFQQYNVQTMQQIASTVHDGFFGQDKSPAGLQRASEAKREFAGLMATTSVLAGALGLPFANAFAGVYNSLMSDKDDPKDVRIALRTWAMDTFGPQMGSVLAKGLPALVNMDSSSFGAQGILPGSDFLADRTLWKDRSETQVRNALGPAVGLGLDLTEAVSRMADGNWLKGVEAALPVGLRSFYKTAEMAGVIGPGGYTDSKGNPLPLKADASDLAWRALGFQTESKALQGDAQRDFIINQQRRENRVKNITDGFVKGVRDPEATQSAVQDMLAYNAKNPLEPITGRDIHKAVAGFETRYALGLASGTGIPVTKRHLPALMQQERFAAMPAR